MNQREEPDRLNESWSEAAPRYTDHSAVSAQVIRFTRESNTSQGKGWFGRILCQLAFIVFFFLPGGLFLGMYITTGWMTGWIGLVPITIGCLLSYFIWKK